MADTPDTARSTARTDGFLLREFVRGATQALETNRDIINTLNVFPVPDGDTGTNMVLTMRSIRDDLEEHIDANPSITSARMARAALLGARGNSGLILAQYFKGLAESLAGGYDISGEGFARGLRIASEIAYKAVPEPREGTMLTVFRECAEASEKAVIEMSGLEHVMKAAAAQAMDTVRRTPEMLDVLRDAGVVDSGGFGFAIMLHSGVEVLAGREAGLERIDPPGISSTLESGLTNPSIRAEFLSGITDEAWGYCTVFAVEGTGLDPDAVRTYLADIGRSPVVAGADNLIKVHVHVEDPGMALSYGLTLGTLSNIDIHNMDEQAKEWASERAAESQANATEATSHTTAVVAIALGEGIKDLYMNAGFGAVHILAGGDTMNPSTAEIVEAIERAPADCVVVLPNNKNVIGTANQAVELTEKKAIVIPTRSMQAGLAALLEFSPDRDIEKNVAQMEEPLSIVRSGSVTKAIRDALLDGVAVRREQYMGVLDEKLVVAGDNALDVLLQLLSGQVDEESLVTIYGGAELGSGALDEAMKKLARTFPKIEVEAVSGGQPDYDFLVSFE